MCVWGGGGGAGGGGGLYYLRAHTHLRFRHAHHETKDWLPRGIEPQDEL